VNID